MGVNDDDGWQVQIQLTVISLTACHGIGLYVRVVFHDLLGFFFLSLPKKYITNKNIIHLPKQQLNRTTTIESIRRFVMYISVRMSCILYIDIVYKQDHLKCVIFLSFCSPWSLLEFLSLFSHTVYYRIPESLLNSRCIDYSTTDWLVIITRHCGV